MVNLSPHVFIPAPAQGALGLQVRDEDHFLKEQLKKLNDIHTSESVHFERAILNQLGGGCHSPLVPIVLWIIWEPSDMDNFSQ